MKTNKYTTILFKKTNLKLIFKPSGKSLQESLKLG